jgi:hypothetical protein
MTLLQRGILFAIRLPGVVYYLLLLPIPVPKNQFILFDALKIFLHLINTFE